MKIIFHLLVPLFVVFALVTAVPAQMVDTTFQPIQTSVEDMELIDVGTVTDILKSDMIRLDNGKRYLLDNVRIPPFFLINATDYLTRTLVGKKVGVYVNPRVLEEREDENGTIFGQIQTQDGVWIQGDMVSKGFAWVYSTNIKRDLVLPLYKKETVAREKKLGFWADKEYKVRNIRDVHAFTDSFQIFDGVIRSVKSDFGRNVDFYFGEDNGENSFVMKISKDNIFLFLLEAGKFVDFDSFDDMRIRIRGWVKQGNPSPYIEITHPEQIEFPDFEKHDREFLFKTEKPPPMMPYDIKFVLAPKKGK